jgi:hypothetical protein
MIRTALRSLLGLMLALLLSALTASPVLAASGSYTVTACSPTASSGAWQQINTSSSGMSSGNQCGGPLIGPLSGGDTGALYGEDLAGSTSPVPAGAQAGWSFTAPANTTITAISYYRSLATGNDGDWIAGLTEPNGTQLDICHTSPTPCSSPNNQVAVTRSGLNATSLFFGVQCEPIGPDTDCLPGATQHFAQADMYSARVTLSETASPTVAGLSGSLWSGAVVWGTQPVTFSSTDPSGISQIALDGPDGQVALQPQSCDFSQTQPCPQLPEASISLDTTQLRDGPQTLTVVVTDAAGNTTSIKSPELIVDNNGPPAPTSLTATPVGGGSDAVELSWSDPANPPQPVSGAFAQLCQTTCGTPTPINGSGGAQITAPAPGAYTIRLWLVDQAGRGSPANAATTAVTVPTPTPPTASKPAAKKPALRVRTLTWHDGILELDVTGLPKGAKLHVDLKYAHRRVRRLIFTRERLSVHTARPRAVVLRAFNGKRQAGRTISTQVRATVTAAGPT